MQKVAIGVLALLLLFFAAANVRLTDRQRRLEENIARLEARPRPKPQIAPEAPAPAEPAPEPVAKPAKPVPEAPVAAPAAAAVVDRAQHFVVRALNNAEALASAAKRSFVYWTHGVSDADLGLSESQKRTIEGLREYRDARTKDYRAAMEKIEEQTDLAIRQLLTPEQLQKYDARGVPQAELQIEPQVVEDAGTAPAGQGPGYLGISPFTAEGGGAEIGQIYPNTAASAFGLQKGDVILEFEQQKIATIGDLTEKIKGVGAGSFVALRIRRNGSEFTQSVQLGTRP